MIFNVSVLSIQKRTMNKNLCQHCPNIKPTIIVTVGQHWVNVILKIFWRWANIAPTIVGPTLGHFALTTLAQHWKPTLAQQSEQRWPNVGPTYACCLGTEQYVSSVSKCNWLTHKQAQAMQIMQTFSLLTCCLHWYQNKNGNQLCEHVKKITFRLALYNMV